MRNIKLLFITAIILTLITGNHSADAQNTSSLNTEIRNESSALKGLSSDLGPGEMQNLQGVAKQLGDPNITSELGQLQAGGQQFSLGGSSLSGAMATLSQQVRNIPGIGPMLAAFGGSGKASISGPRKFPQNKVVSRLLRSNSANIISHNSGIMSSMGMIGQLLGTSSMGQNAACQSELNQASSVMPAAIKNLEQENQEYKQLMAE